MSRLGLRSQELPEHTTGLNTRESVSIDRRSWRGCARSEEEDQHENHYDDDQEAEEESRDCCRTSRRRPGRACQKDEEGGFDEEYDSQQEDSSLRREFDSYCPQDDADKEDSSGSVEYAVCRDTSYFRDFSDLRDLRDLRDLQGPCDPYYAYECYGLHEYTSVMIALPILIVTSYYLFDRLALGNPQKSLWAPDSPPPPPPETNEEQN
ncbi:hypothetical protein NKR23_g10592 [Pleurostoma richardsiae]|uniref:Uncharacterized protein n=1 Tax=Pleurostoma richardsiae TaxID=41990 RepID=A0AA38RCS4_9PEZI|nr:hypothetical protein NKR23_g10592 [Pleurostoma richardsiae]